MDKKKLSIREAVTIIRRATWISLSIKSRASVVCSLIGLLVAFLPVVISRTIELLANEVQGLYWGNLDSLTHVILLVIMLGLLYIIQIAYQGVQSYYSKVDTLKIAAYVKRSIIENECSVAYKYINNVDGYIEKIGMADTISGNRVAGAIQTTAYWLHSLLSFCSIFYVLIRLSPWITVALLITTIPAAVLAYLQNDETFRFDTRRIKEGQLLMNNFTEMVGPKEMIEVRYWGIIEHLKSQWKSSATAYITQKKLLTSKHVLYNSLADILRNGVYILILFIAAHKVFIDPRVGIGEFMLVISLSSQFQTITTNLLVTIVGFLNDAIYMREFFDLETYDKEAANESDEQFHPAEIVFQNVSFTYPETNTEVLHNINLSIKAGEKVAIVGENGSGKTTFVNLLCGFYTPSTGEIYVDGDNLTDCIGKVRSRISGVFQDFNRYEASVKDNITVSDKNRMASEMELELILKQAGLDSIVAKLPDGITEIIGTFSNFGKKLSGGEWQKIALARAIYRESSSIMILDEPTAALDPKAEAEIYQSFANMAKDKTTLLITHRLGAIKVVDRILVFKEGTIVEEGNHEALMKLNGVYANMYRAQANWYK